MLYRPYAANLTEEMLIPQTVSLDHLRPVGHDISPVLYRPRALVSRWWDTSADDVAWVPRAHRSPMGSKGTSWTGNSLRLIQTSGTLAIGCVGHAHRIFISTSNPSPQTMAPSTRSMSMREHLGAHADPGTEAAGLGKGGLEASEGLGRSRYSTSSTSIIHPTAVAAPPPFPPNQRPRLTD